MGGTTYSQRREKTEEWRDEAFGSKGSTLGGPEASKTTPNIQIRADAEVLSHIPDFEEFLDLIGKLSADLLKANPNSPTLQDDAILDALTESRKLIR